MWDANVSKKQLEFCHSVRQMQIHVCHLQNSFLGFKCLVCQGAFGIHKLYPVDFAKCLTKLDFAQFLNDYSGKATVSS